MKYSVVTTFHKPGYDLYGKRMIQTFIQNWPKDITLYVYHQDVVPSESAPNLVLRDLNQVPELIAFKNKWKDDPKARGWTNDSTRRHDDKKKKEGFRWDAIRFSHKVYAIFDCVHNTDADILFWMDADMVCHSPITLDFIRKMSPSNIDLGYLGRKDKYSECGLYSLNLRSEETQKFLKEFQHVYDDAENGIFTMREWHDSFVFDTVRTRFPNIKSYNWSDGIVTGEGHPLINCEWGAYLDHLKGEDRKRLGKSKTPDLKISRNEPYWRTAHRRI